MTGIEAWLSRAIHRITAVALGVHQAAVIRIGFSLTWLLFLLREFPHRQELYGPDSPWSWSMGRRLVEDNGAFTALLWSDSQIWFETVYALAIVSSVLLLLGWRTRTMSVLFMIGVLSLENRSIFMSDGGDNVIHLMAIYLVLTRCGVVWSLDARRARRSATARALGGRLPAEAVGPLLWSVLGLALLVVTANGWTSSGWLLIFWGLWAVHGLWWYVDRRVPRGAGAVAPAGPDGPGGPDRPGGPAVPADRNARNEPRLLLDVIANLAHNAGLLVIMVEACLIYSTAGWYKIQGSRWQDGTAVYFPLHLDYFSPWPALSDLLGRHGLVVLLITYGTVMVQVAFPFALFNRRVKNVLLVAMICEHTAIAVLLGLPFFSLAMIAADAVFLPTSFLRWLGTVATRVRSAVLRGRHRTEGGSHVVPAGTEAEAGGHQDAGRGGDGEDGSTESEDGSTESTEEPHDPLTPPGPRNRPADGSTTSLSTTESRS